MFKDEEELLRPKVKLVGNMHGNEPVGRELLIHLAKYLLHSKRDGDARASGILRSTDLYILPTMNPDGFGRGQEGRCAGGNYGYGRLSEGMATVQSIYDRLKMLFHYFKIVRQ